MGSETRLAITGSGMVNSVGGNRQAAFDGFCRGDSGVGPLVHLDADRFKMQRAYEIHAGGSASRASWLLTQVLEEAVSAAGLDVTRDRVTVLIGTGLRELRRVEQWHTEGHECPSHQLHFRAAAERVVGSGATVMTIANACSASLFTLALAEDLLRLDEADMVIVAGTDSITTSMFGLVDRTNSDPPNHLAPFDRTRKGVLMGEGAAAVVVETARSAARRGRAQLAWLRGVGVSCDAHHETVPERSGMLSAMQEAHRRSGTSPDDVDLLFPHGTGTAMNDATEALAIADLFADRVGSVIMSGLKSLTGHTSGASGLMAAVTAIECLRQGRVPVTRHFDNPMPEAEQFAMVTQPTDKSVRLAQVNAFGFGGVNAVALLERVEVGH
jgi:3-oxoacyl-[acyl-carrier-protein] synthase II